MEKKKLLIFAHYYYPDVASTGQLLKEQAEGMLDEFDVTVICTVPSYGGEIEDRYKTQKFYEETINGVRVIRIRVPEFTKASKTSRIFNIAAYFFGALGAARRAGEQDFVLTISQPPLLGGLLGVYGKRLKHAKLIYCIQDFNPEQIEAVGYFKNRWVLDRMLQLDKFSCRRSDLVVTVGRDLVETLERRFEGEAVPNHVMINNWMDEKEVYPLPPEHEKVLAFRERYGLQDKFVIMYSGNIGLYYDLEKLMTVIENFKPGTRAADGREAAFVFVGGGAVLDNLRIYAREHGMRNVKFIPYQDKAELNYSLNAADVHWCVNAKGIKGTSCPSKWYGIASAAKPILGVLEQGSEIRMLIEEIGCGLVCEPEAYGEMEQNIQWFLDHAASSELQEMGQRGRAYLEKNLTKDVSIQKYIEAIKKLET